MRIYVEELIKPIKKLRIFLSDKNTTYNIPDMQDSKVNQLNFRTIVKIMHTVIIREKKE